MNWKPKQPQMAVLMEAIGSVIVESDIVIRQILLALLADGHVLIESMPGLGKTTLVTALQKCIADTKAARLQMTPDFKPSDVIGLEIWDPRSGSFVKRPGPIVTADLVLADEINRTTAKTNSALLQAMQERIVTLGDTTYQLSDLFLVLATINPVEMGGEGTFTLPEAMLDRFACSVRMEYLSRAGEIELAMRDEVHGRNATASLSAVVSKQELLEMRVKVLETAKKMSPVLVEYIVDLVESTRPGTKEFAALEARSGKKFSGAIKFGLGPRAIIWTKRLASALAFCEGDDSVTPEHVKQVFADVARHRLVMSDIAEINGDKPDDIILAALDPNHGVAVISNHR